MSTGYGIAKRAAFFDTARRLMSGPAPGSIAAMCSQLQRFACIVTIGSSGPLNDAGDLGCRNGAKVAALVRAYIMHDADVDAVTS
jgi:hypothetical protein